jgi:hypothetical protein
VAERPGSDAQTFGAGWDRQDRWLRFLDPALERDYREAMTPAARRRFRSAAFVGVATGVVFPLLLPILGLG